MRCRARRATSGSGWEVMTVLELVSSEIVVIAETWQTSKCSRPKETREPEAMPATGREQLTRPRLKATGGCLPD